MALTLRLTLNLLSYAFGNAGPVAGETWQLANGASFWETAGGASFWAQAGT